jgi:SAM-dependent methyltransferase
MSFGNEDFGEAYFATTYRDYRRQNPARKLEFYRSVVEHHMPEKLPIRVLDVGCGMGGFLACLRASDPKRSRLLLTGADVSEYAIAACRKRLPDENFVVSPSQHLADLNQTFEVVTAFDVLEHLSNPDETASAISACLTPDGLVTIVVPVYDGPLGPFVRLFDNDRSHLQLRSRTWWLDWTSTHFTVTGWQGIFRTLTPWRQYIHVPTRALRRVAPAILITATKQRT